MFKPLLAQEIWRESFQVPGKGIWGNGVGTVVTDFSGISAWTLDYSSVELSDSEDYAKTVSTAGGRFEAHDINGEVCWRSEWIDIEGLENVSVELLSAETGSGTNTSTKYMKVLYRLDGGPEVPFGENGINAGNWGTLTASQKGIKGKQLQVVCYLSTHYAADKVILDEVVVLNQQAAPLPVYRNEVVINELMTDPYPPAGLPEVEYIELYNTLDVPVHTGSWELRIEGVDKKLMNAVIEPHGYLLLCASGSIDSLSSFGAVSTVTGFQGLRNSGAVVEIVNSEGTVIDRIAYTEDWFGDDSKRRGGWSIERIDPLRNCNQTDNWKASQHPDGGTPGYINSVYTVNKDETPPSVKWAVAVSETLVEVVFTEPSAIMTMLDSSCYLLSETGNPEKIDLLSEKKVLLHFSKVLEQNKIYSLSIANVADDCGNYMDEQYLEVQWNILEPGDVLVNEILFDPYPGGGDYIEIYNMSEKLIDLSRLLLASRNDDKELDQVFSMTSDRMNFLPGGYLALTKDTNTIFPWYNVNCLDCFLQMNSVPSFSNEKGCVAILNKEKQVIDEFYYNADMHSPFLAGTEGVSLERVSLAEPAGLKGNWQSAAEDAGYGTPGYKNSQAASGLTGKPMIVFEPEAFSPNYDGYNDEYLIHYELSEPGYLANMKIFDATGRFILQFLKNETLGTTGELRWNGEDETGRRLPVGMYIVLLELFNGEGEVYRFKDGVVLTGIIKSP